MSRVTIATVVGLMAAAHVLGSCGRGADLLAHLGVCDNYPEPATSQYVLPWSAGTTRRVSQGNCRPVSHYGAGRYAYDIVMPVGTEILATRAGEVVEVVEEHANGNGCPDDNHVFVRHDDGTVAAYVHLDQNGALVAVGDTVTQGQHIANSGNTGCSTAPHLHFQVWKDASHGETVPVTFSNAGENSRGLTSETDYAAL